jgi:hypothetical protein
MCGESANRCSLRVRARPSMRGQVGPDVQPPAPRLPGWRTTLLGAPRGKTALMRTKMAMESCSLMTRQHWTAACARRCAQMAWPWKIQHLHDVVLQPTRRKSAASKTPRESLPFARPLGACLLQHRVTVNYLAKSLTILFRLVTAKPKRKGIIATTENSFDSGQRQPTCFFSPLPSCGRSRTPACPADALHMSLVLQKWPTHCHELGRTHTAVGRSCAVPHGPSTSKSTPILTAGTRGR